MSLFIIFLFVSYVVWAGVNIGFFFTIFFDFGGLLWHGFAFWSLLGSSFLRSFISLISSLVNNLVGIVTIWSCEMSPCSSGNFPNLVLATHVPKLNVEFDLDEGLVIWFFVQSYSIKAFSPYGFLFVPFLCANDGENNFLQLLQVIHEWKSWTNGAMNNLIHNIKHNYIRKCNQTNM